MKIWTVATDTEDGTETHVFHTEEAFDRFMHDFLQARWAGETGGGPMPEYWRDAWEAMGCTLGDLDTFTCGEEELYDHPLVVEVLAALNSASERLQMNNYGDEESQYIGELAGVIAKRTKPIDHIEKLKGMGWLVGDRDPGMNRAHQGKYMVAEPLEEGDPYPTDDASDGRFCIVGDDLSALAKEAYEHITT